MDSNDCRIHSITSASAGYHGQPSANQAVSFRPLLDPISVLSVLTNELASLRVQLQLAAAALMSPTAPTPAPPPSHPGDTVGRMAVVITLNITVLPVETPQRASRLQPPIAIACWVAGSTHRIGERSSTAIPHPAP